MATADDDEIEVTPELLLQAYAAGIFPMAESADDPTLFWIEPVLRGILPLDRFHVPRSLAKTVRQQRFDIRIDTDFQGVIDGCAAPAAGRRTTWINSRVRELYGALFAEGHCHTVEAWLGDEMVGGLYGVSLGGAFFGESMFSRATDASKVALVYLVARLKAGGYRLLDAQFTTEHLQRFGAIELDKRAYRRALAKAIATEADFYFLAGGATGDEVLQLTSHTS